MTVAESFRQRVSNLIFWSVPFLVGVGFSCAMGWAVDPFMSYVGYWCLGAAIGLPAFIAYDLWRTRARS